MRANIIHDDYYYTPTGRIRIRIVSISIYADSDYVILNESNIYKIEYGLESECRDCIFNPIGVPGYCNKGMIGPGKDLCEIVRMIDMIEFSLLNSVKVSFRSVKAEELSLIEVKHLLKCIK